MVVDSRLYFVVLRHGPGGMVRALISDATFQEWVLAAEVVERYGIAVETGTTVDDVANAFTVYPSLSGSIAEVARVLHQTDQG